MGHIQFFGELSQFLSRVLSSPSPDSLLHLTQLLSEGCPTKANNGEWKY